MNGLWISEACTRLGISADTLRYYERIHLVPPIERDTGGRRRLRRVDMERLRFVRRAQAMNFSLEEIRGLLMLRENPGQARAETRRLTAAKLAAIEQRLRTLTHLRDELALLLNLCADAKEGCPILESMSSDRA